MNDFAENSLLSILERRALLEPDRTALFFLRDGSNIQDRLSYGQLLAEARRVAAYLTAQQMEAQRILLLFPPGLDFVKAFLGCLIAKAIAVPVFPPHRNDHLRRMAAISADAQSTLALSTHTAIRRMEKLGVDKVLDGLPPCLALEDMQVEATTALPGTFDRTAVAFLQYTSGSTGNPKGIMIRHGNLLQNLADLDQGGGHTPDSSILSWLPVYHDMGLIYGVLLPLYKGIPGYLLSPVSFLARPFQWLEAMSHYKITHSVAPNFAFDLCMDAGLASSMDGMDFSHLIALGNGAEPIRADTLLRFWQWLAPFGLKKEALCPCYGLAEATLKVATKSSDQDLLILPLDARQLKQGVVEVVSGDSAAAKFVVGCGSSTIDTAVCIVDPATELACAPGQIGEIWVKGSTVAGGYWNQPATSAAVFAAHRKDNGEGPFLRTGDLGFLQEGQLFVTGRIKEMLIIHGVNHYPHDIEATVQASHPLLQKEICAAIALTVAGEERLVVLQEFGTQHLGDGNHVSAICEAIHDSVVQHHEIVPLSVILVKRRSIPHTSSGKKQRLRCRALLEEGKLDIVSYSKPFFEKADSPESWISAMVFQAMVQADGTALVWGKQTITYRQLLVGWQSAMENQGLGLAAEEGVSFLARLGTRLATATTAGVAPIDDLLRPILERPSAFLPGRVEAWAPFVVQLRQKFTGQASATVGIPGSLPPHLALASAIWAWSKGTAVYWPAPGTPEAGLDFSLLYFSSQAAAFNNDKYRLLTAGARFADQHAFKAVWIPERHFHDFGGLYPDPAVLAAYLAAQTSRIRLRAGSVVLTLHDPILVAESWAVVDNLSGGRVDLAFARGWNPNDFVLSPDTYANSTDVLFQRVKTVQQLWQGESVARTNGNGASTSVRIFPLPAQAQLQTWITCSGGPDRFAEAGALGANVLTALLFQTPGQLAEKIQTYRRARASHGFDPETGIVTLMLHTHLGADTTSVREQVRAPFMGYLKSSVDLWKNGFADLGTLEAEGMEQLLDYAFERYYREAALFGTVEDCLPMLQQLRASGVNEIACLLDFGVPDEAIIASFPYLERLKAAFALPVPVPAAGKDLGEIFWVLDACFTPDLPEREKPPAPPTYPNQASMPRAVGSLPTYAEVTEKIRKNLSVLLDTPIAMIATDQSFQRLGLNSIKAVRLTTVLSDEWGIDIPPTWLFEFTSIDALARQIAQTLQLVPQAGKAQLSQDGETESALALDKVSDLPEADLVELLRNTLKDLQP